MTTDERKPRITKVSAPIPDELSTPPKMKAESKSQKPAPASAPSKPGVIAAGVEKFYCLIAMGAMPFLPETGKMIFESAGNIAEAAESWAKADPVIRARFLKLIRTGEGSQFALAHVPFFLALAAEMKAKQAAKRKPEEEAEEPRERPKNAHQGPSAPVYQMPGNAVV